MMKVEMAIMDQQKVEHGLIPHLDKVYYYMTVKVTGLL